MRPTQLDKWRRNPLDLHNQMGYSIVGPPTIEGKKTIRSDWPHPIPAIDSTDVLFTVQVYCITALIEWSYLYRLRCERN